MSTFFGGDQLIAITTLTRTTSGTNSVIYTVPAGHFAYVSFIGANGFWSSLTSEIYNPTIGLGLQISASVGLMISVTHPFAGGPKGADEGSQVRITGSGGGSASAQWVVYLYKKP